MNHPLTAVEGIAGIIANVADTLQFLVEHGYVVLFVSVLAQQLGVPLPSTPFIVAAGALAHSGQLSFSVALLVGCCAAIMADIVWFENLIVLTKKENAW